MTSSPGSRIDIRVMKIAAFDPAVIMISLSGSTGVA